MMHHHDDGLPLWREYVDADHVAFIGTIDRVLFPAVQATQPAQSSSCLKQQSHMRVVPSSLLFFLVKQ